MAENVTIRLADVEVGLKNLISAVSDSAQTDFFHEVKDVLKDDLKQHQKDRRGPSSPWPRRKPGRSYQQRRNAQGRFVSGRKATKQKRRGRLLGKLPKAFKSYISPDHIKLRQMVVWAFIHDTGGRVGRGAVIPARKFAYISQAVADDVSKAWATKFVAAWKA